MMMIDDIKTDQEESKNGTFDSFLDHNLDSPFKGEHWFWAKKRNLILIFLIRLNRWIIIQLLLNSRAY